MIQLNNHHDAACGIEFVYQNSKKLKGLSKSIQAVFKGEHLQSIYIPGLDERGTLLVGLGKEDEIDSAKIKEASAKAAKIIKEHQIMEFAVDISTVMKSLGLQAISDLAEGIMLGLYEFKSYGADKKKNDFSIYFKGLKGSELEKAQEQLEKAINVTEGIIFARDLVNTPGNKLRPMEFANRITELMNNTDVEVERLVTGQLKTLEMDALISVGQSSEYPPCLMILRYMGNPGSHEITGLIGKGVTCDTGGYCLKPSNSMLGIKGDMAGGAAVVGALYGLAKNKVKSNIVVIVPICENRISPGSLLPGDVISSMSGKTIEIINTDAEGRLILADAVTYAVQKEKVTRVLDIATLTGAVVGMFGFSVAGVLSDDQEFWEEFKVAYEKSGERYWRLPIYPEHKKMIKSTMADIKNQGESHCGTITAGLFIRAFAEDKPWLHIDIAGTAWVDSPVFEYQSKGATGAGVTTLYHLCAKGD